MWGEASLSLSSVLSCGFVKKFKKASEKDMKKGEKKLNNSHMMEVNTYLLGLIL